MIAIGTLKIDDAIWCLRVLPEEYGPKIRLFACDIAEHVLPIWEKGYPNDKRPAEAIRISSAFARGEASKEELVAASDAAWAAAVRALAEREAARAAAAWAARAAAAWAESAARAASASAASAARAAAGGDEGAEREYQRRAWRLLWR